MYLVIFTHKGLIFKLFCTHQPEITAMFKEHNNMFKVLAWPWRSPDLSPVSMCGKCWTNKSDPERPHLQLAGLKGSAAIAPVPDTTAHLQGSAGVHASAIVENVWALFLGSTLTQNSVCLLRFRSRENTQHLNKLQTIINWKHMYNCTTIQLYRCTFRSLLPIFIDLKKKKSK